ncbi:MAG TPA: tyrosine-type recombinase/integrase [Pyrinomonadaceae bacterium]|jgi:integrase
MAVFKKLFIKKYGRKVYGYIGFIDGRKRRKFGFATSGKAQDAFYNARVQAKERRAGIHPDAPPVTVEQLIDKRTASLPVPKGMPGHDSRRSAVLHLKAFLAMLPDGMLVTQLTTADTAAYRDARLEAGIAPQTVFRELTNIQSCFNKAREHFPQLETWRSPAKPQLKIPRGTRNRVITPDEIARLLTYLRRPREETHESYSREPSRTYLSRIEAADFLQLALQSAMRPSEIVCRAWADVIWHANRLLIDATKTDEEGTIDLPESCMEMLKRRREQHKDSPWIFPSLYSNRRHMYRAPTQLIRRASLELGIPWGYAARNGIVLYTTRHTAATAMLDAGNDLPTVQAQTRHSTKNMLMRYAHATARSRRAAAAALDSFSNNSCAGSCASVTPETPSSPPNPRPKVKAKAAKSGAKS